MCAFLLFDKWGHFRFILEKVKFLYTQIHDIPVLTLYSRDVLELTEAIRMKDLEAEAYISEIEVISCF